MPRLLRSVAIPAAAVLLCGCSSGKLNERYHFPGIRDGRVVNYYRVDVEGRVKGTQLRYLSGFFDEDALNRYFNTFSQPDGGALLSWTNVKEDGEQANDLIGSSENRDADPQGRGRKLVLLLSQNSEAVAEQIGSIAQSEAFATIVSRIVFADDIAELEQGRLEADRVRLLAEASRADAAELAARLRSDTNLSAAEAQALLLQFINRTAASLGAPGAFATVSEARAWLENNRRSLIGGAS